MKELPCNFGVVDSTPLQDRTSLPIVDENLCVDCGKCKEYCPMGAFEEE